MKIVDTCDADDEAEREPFKTKIASPPTFMSNNDSVETKIPSYVKATKGKGNSKGKRQK